MGRRAGQCGPQQSAELRQASRLRRSMAIDVGRGRSSAPVVFLLTRVEAAEDKASEKLIALPDRPNPGTSCRQGMRPMPIGDDLRRHRKGGHPHQSRTSSPTKISTGVEERAKRKYGLAKWKCDD